MINTAPGSRNADVYILSIVSALAQRLIDVRIHSNIAKVTVLLGRRLLQAARHLAGTRLTTEVPLSVDFGDGVAWLVTEDEGELQFPALNGVFGTLDPFNFERQDWGSLPESFFDELGL